MGSGKDVYEVAVVGAGPIGSATARHLSGETSSVVLVGPDDALEFATHTGAWSGWADQARAWATIDIPLPSGVISVRSGRRFAELESQTGISFTTPNPQLTIASMTNGAQVGADLQGVMDAAGTDYYDPTLLMQRATDLGVRAEHLEGPELVARIPELSLPENHYGVLQPDSCLINPRRLVAAQRAAALSAGATHIAEEVRAWDRRGECFELKLDSGAGVRARQIVLAAGAYNNLTGLSPRPLSMYVLGFTIGLVQVAPDTPRFPTLLCRLELGESSYFGIIAPPVQYPDGNWYIKSAGPNMTELEDAGKAAAWVRSGGDASEADLITAALSVIAPDVVPLSAAVRPCIVTINESVGYPYIGLVEEGVTVATEGENGVSMSDEIGRLAARLVLDGAWRDALPEQLFAPRFAGPGPV